MFTNRIDTGTLHTTVCVCVCVKHVRFRSYLLVLSSRVSNAVEEKVKKRILADRSRLRSSFYSVYNT